jgi:HD superfamily phosphohydrolase
MTGHLTPKPYMIFDAIHHVMEIGIKETDLLKHLIDSPHFQRLKGIKQLGLTDMVFPTATHTRFSHSLGTAFLASKIFKLLESRHREDIATISPCSLILAALLHDIGHGPFSHACEDFFYHYLNQEIKHESWTKEFIKHLSEEGSLPIHLYDEIDTILFPSAYRTFVNDIICSQLDADRLDYLLRDSHFCGVSYGTFDLDWLLHSLTILKPTEGSAGTKLGIVYKGLGAVENYLISRRWMHLNIYQNRKLLGFTDNLLCFLIQLALWIDEKENQKEKENISGTFLFEFLKKINHCKKEQKSHGEVIKEAFHWYKFLTDYDIWSAIRNIYFAHQMKSISLPQSLQEIAISFIERKTPKVKEIKKDQEGEIRDFIAAHNLTHLKHKINIIKPPFSTYEANGSSIYVQHNHHSFPIQEKSGIINELLLLKEERLFLKLDPSLDLSFNLV